MNEIELKENVKIEDMIYEIRGVQVMLDSDLAMLYECKNGTKEINQAVKNNPNKFPERFCFRITDEEVKNLKSKFLTSSYGGSRKGHNVFTEQGVAMLATILKSNVAIKVSINIMDAFVSVRKYISNELTNINVINTKLLEHDNRITLLEETFNKLEEKEKINTIFFQGQIFDAYMLLMEIFESAKKEIIIIDDYAGKELLNILKEVDRKIKIVSSNINEIDKKKYESQYQNVTFIYNNKFHDRFIIIDRIELYHPGSSFKDLGKKCFAINKIKDNEYLSKIIENF